MPTEMSPSRPTPDAPRVALIGFGEAGSTFARAGGWEDEATAFDIDPSRRAAMAECGVAAASGVQEALNGAEAVLSLVTADQAVPAAEACAQHLAPGTLWLDMNSVAPDTKRRAAAAVVAAGGAYVDVAVMAPVDPARLNVPLLVAGPDAARAEALLRALGFARVRVVGSEVGQASAIKLCRSIMVKGLEALTAEMVLAAGKAGVLDEVLASLDASEKQVTWADRTDYNLDRMLQHGRRRAAEMAEAAAMLRDLGIAPLMTENTVNWQQGIGELGLSPPPDGLDAKLAAIQGKMP